MSKNKENVPKIRFPGFTGAWERRKLGELADFSKGKGYTKNDLIENGLPIVLYGRLYTKYEMIINNVDTFVKMKDKAVISEGNEVIVPSSGETAEDISRASVVGKSGFIIGGDLNIIKPEPEIDPVFLALTISNGAQQKEISKRAQGKPVVHLYNSDLKQVNLLYPKLGEQRRIGRFFVDLDCLITLHQRKMNNIKNLKAGLLQKMFPKKGENFPEIRFPGFTHAWEQHRLGDMGDTFTGLSGKTKKDFGHGDAEFVTYMNVFTNPIASTNGTARIEIDGSQNEIKYGDVFFTTSSETPEEVGMSSLWLENRANVYLNSFCFGWRPTVDFDPLYLAFMLRSPGIRKKFVFLAQGISRYNISKNKVMEMTVPIPMLDEQELVGEFFIQLDHLITLHQRKLEHLQKQKKALLQQMFV